jgi:hypothetical protein
VIEAKFSCLHADCICQVDSGGLSSCLGSNGASLLWDWRSLSACCNGWLFGSDSEKRYRH